MSFDRLLVRDVTIVHPGAGTSLYGDNIADWSATTTEGVKGWLARLTSEENLEGRDALISGWKLYVDKDTTLAATDRVVIDGTTYEIDGPVLDAWRPTGIHHREALLRLAVG